MIRFPATPATTTIILCRHGESEWNVAQRIQGQSPDAGGLTTTGRTQAHLLGRRLQRMQVDILISSDLRRALETARIAGIALGLQPSIDSRWREADIGAWQGLHRDEARQRWPEEWEAARQGDVARGGGETYTQVQARVLAALGDLLAKHPGQIIAVITHGGPIYACLGAVLNHSFPEVFERLPANRNTSVTILRFEHGQVEPLDILDASHLDVLDSALEAELEVEAIAELQLPEALAEH